MSLNIAIQEDNPEIEIMLHPKANNSNGTAECKKTQNKTKFPSAKTRTPKKTQQNKTAPPVPTVNAFPENNATKDGGRRRVLLGPERKEAMRKRAKRAAQKFLVFMVSTVGLSCVVVAYAIVGGFIFMKLEGTTERKSRTAILEIRQRYVHNLWNVTVQMNIFKEEEWIKEADETFLRFQEEIYHAVKDMGWDGSDDVHEINTQWTYAGSLLFSVTVITTIGYGHLTPKTLWGRVVTMLYGLIGIPMTLLCLANIGSFMAHAFRILWKQIVCKPCRKQLRRRSMHIAAKKAAGAKFVGQMTSRKFSQGGPGDFGGSGGGSGMGRVGNVAKGPAGGGVGEKYHLQCGADSPAAVHDSASLLGRPDPPRYSSLDHSERRRFLVGFEGLAGRDSASSLLSDQEEKDREQCEVQGEGQAQGVGQTKSDGKAQSEGLDAGGGEKQGEGREVKEINCPDQSNSSGHPPLVRPEPQITQDQVRKCFEYPIIQVAAVPCDPSPSSREAKAVDVAVEEVVVEAGDSFLSEPIEIKKPKPEVVRVPIMVCLALVAAYICLGATLFTLWENEWSYFDSCYFCFTTLSTIGFGDLVPGYDNKQWGNQAKRVSCTLYLLFGLALLAMCFELIQSEARQMFLHLGRVLGITSDKKVHKTTGSVAVNDKARQ